MGLRDKILHAKPEDLNIQPGSPNRVWGVVTDIALQNGSVCLVALIDGSASLYYSTGGAIQGAVGEDNIMNAATNYAIQCQKFISNTKRTTVFPLPNPGEITFYLLTTNAVYTVSAQKSDLASGRNTLSPLFQAANNLISEFGKTSRK